MLHCVLKVDLLFVFNLNNKTILALPSNCGYMGPHSVQCLTQLWLSAGCIARGEQHPSMIDAAERRRFDGMTVR